jgi:hypothetical protein
MKAKIKRKVFDSHKLPIFIVISPGELELLNVQAKLKPNNNVGLCIHPGDEKYVKDDYAWIKEWMADQRMVEIPKEEVETND